jgi:predicted transcriptional regulator
MDDADIVENLVELLKVLANPIRLKILALCLSKEMTSRELRSELKLSKPLLISHLRKLVNTGMLDCRVELDRKRMIVRKYYRTRNFEICINSRVLEEIFENLKLRTHAVEEVKYRCNKDWNDQQ